MKKKKNFISLKPFPWLICGNFSISTQLRHNPNDQKFSCFPHGKSIERFEFAVYVHLKGFVQYVFKFSCRLEFIMKTFQVPRF